MACFHPLRAYRSRDTSVRGVTFSLRKGYYDLPVTVPCGGCVGCMLERSRQWAIRCMHEASLHLNNCFVTLTYDDEHLPPAGSLDRRAFPLFMKRLRKLIAPEKVRYYHAGEYGPLSFRPHYHACLFGYDFSDKTLWSVRKGFPVFRSATLESLWPFGMCELGSVTFESAAYVARYMLKKQLRMFTEDGVAFSVDQEGVVSEKVPEYTTMSRRPGIGKPWLEKFGCEVYPADSVVVRGKLMKPPRYYDLQIEPDLFERVSRRRRRRRSPRDETPARLAVREKCAVARLSQDFGERGL